MKFSLPRIFSTLIKIFFILGFFFYQFTYTLIVGFGWPFVKFSAMNGCMMEINGYGWPLSFYEVTTSCGLCCDGVIVPFSSFNFTNLFTDIVYLLGLALVCFYIFKVMIFILKNGFARVEGAVK